MKCGGSANQITKSTRRRGELGDRPSVPAAGAAAVLLLQPLSQRGEVLEQRVRLDAALAGERLQRVGPGLAGAELQRGAQARSRLLAPVDRALVQRARVARRPAQRAVELELQQPRQEVPGV